ncbi:MAG: alpha/beta fold hydrolase [Solirubrobacteraceae bacterium]
MTSLFTPAHRGGAGEPLVLLHGFMDTWCTWDLVLPALERRHDVLAPTLAGHAGGPPLAEPVTNSTLADAVGHAMDEAGIATAHIAGNSLGGWLALQLAARGRARSVVALAPAGGWADDAYESVFDLQLTLQQQVRLAAPRAELLLERPQGRRRATLLSTVNYEHIPRELLVHQMVGIAACEGAARLVAVARDGGYALDAERIGCPVRIVWGTQDRLLPWPDAAERFRRDWLPHADWVVLDDVGHCPQLDVPLETAELILGFTTP